MSDRLQDENAAADELTVDRRGLLVKGGLAAAGATFLASPAAAFATGASASAGTIKVAVVTHGDTGSFWSVFKKGVDQAAKDLEAAASASRRSTRTTTSRSRWRGSTRRSPPVRR